MDFNFNFGKFEIREGQRGFYVFRGGEPMSAIFGTRDEAKNFMINYVVDRVREALLLPIPPATR